MTENTVDLLTELAFSKTYNEYLEKNKLNQIELKEGYFLAGFSSEEALQIVYNYFHSRNGGVSGAKDFTALQFIDQSYIETQLQYTLDQAKLDIFHLRLGMKNLGDFPYWLLYKL